MRRTIALAAGLVVSTLLLGGGWLGSTLRERETRMADARAALVRSADAVRAAVDESLEELRLREDQRHFYLYNHYYSPPDVLSITDPVAVSPLARVPADRRIVGHFQIEPGGGVRTPYADLEQNEPPLGRAIRELVASEAFAPIRALATGDDRDTVLARPRLGEPEPTPAQGMLSLSVLGAAQQSSAPLPLTTNLAEYGTAQAQDIQAAQAGDPEANYRVMQRGRQVPIMSRRDVTWEQAEQQQQAPRAQSSAPRPQSSAPRPAPRPSRAAVESALADLRGAVLACTEAAPLSVQVTLRGQDGRVAEVVVEGPAGPDEARCVEGVLGALRVGAFDGRSMLVRYAYRGERPAARVPSLDNMVQRETEVEYTPMIVREVGGAIVLHRLVSHGGASIVQGVLLDEGEIVERWIPSVVARHVEDGAPSVVRAGEGECALRRAASAIVPGVELCFAPAALASATASIDAELAWQIAALFALWTIALLAAAAIVWSARRAEALSQQKSAFVSAVSHELRTPLTTLRMHAEMLEEGLVTDERRPKVYGELVRESVRLSRLVDNVLSLSKLEEGRRRIRASEGDLRAHVRDIVEGQRRFVVERGFSLEAPRGDEPLDARFDAQAVEQIVVNLLDNAVKYGGGDVRAIEVEVLCLAGAPYIVVRDRGPGIPAGEREKVFERFHRVEREETAHAPGTGIGLALVAELAQAHGGAASVHPREGGGLEVRVRLAPAG